ncbi:MAG TPA: hypothetical protein VKU00_01120 [Chthonomonadaceae bacterium]|nr:hypothetical protein [Chthonomonadaceae bacterium]
MEALCVVEGSVTKRFDKEAGCHSSEHFDAGERQNADGREASAPRARERRGGEMHFPEWWYWMSMVAFAIGSVALLVSGVVFGSLVSRLLPLLTETHQQVQDLGDLASNTVGRAADTMELVEMRASQTMGQAAQAGKTLSQRALSVGTTLAGAYMVVRFIQTVRRQWSGVQAKRRSSRSRGWWRRKND